MANATAQKGANTAQQTTVANTNAAAAQQAPAQVTAPTQQTPALAPNQPVIGAGSTAGAKVAAAAVLTAQQQQLLTMLQNVSPMQLPANIGNSITAQQMLTQLNRRQITANCLANTQVYTFNLAHRYWQTALVQMLVQHIYGVSNFVTVPQAKARFAVVTGTFMQAAQFYCLLWYYTNVVQHMQAQALTTFATTHGFSLSAAAAAAAVNTAANS